MRPLIKIIEDLLLQLTQPTQSPKLSELIEEFDKKCCDKDSINELKDSLELVQSINMKIIEIYASTVSSFVNKYFKKLKLEEIKTWPNAPTFINLKDRWDCLSLFIVNDIVGIKKLEKRNLQIERWISVAKRLHEQQDFFSAGAIISSIKQREVERLYQDAIGGLSLDALRRLNELSKKYNLPPKKFNNDYVIPAIGPKLSNVHSFVSSSKADREGNSSIIGREQRGNLAIAHDESILEVTKKLYSDYQEKIVANKIHEPLVKAILAYKSQARCRRMLPALETKCIHLEDKIGLLKTEITKNPTPENNSKLKELQKEKESTLKAKDKLSAKQEKAEKKLEKKSYSLKPPKTLLSPSALTLEVGSLIPRTPTLPSVTPPPVPKSAPTPTPLVPKTEPIAPTRNRSQSTSVLSGDMIPLDLHGSNIVTQPEPITRKRSPTMSDLSTFFASASKNSFPRSNSVRSMTPTPRPKRTGSVRVK